MEIDDGILVVPLPDQDTEQGRRADCRHNHDEMRPEPVIALTFVQDNLQRSEAQGQQSQSDVIDLETSTLSLLHIGWIGDQTVRKKKRNNSHRYVDEENPTPVEIVSDPSA